MHNRYHNIQVINVVWQLKAAGESSAVMWLKATVVKSVQLMLVPSLLAVVVVFAVPVVSAADAPPTETGLLGSVPTAVERQHITVEGLEITRVQDGVYVRYGRHEPVSAGSIADIANHGFIIGETGVAIVDPGGSIEVARRTVAALREVTSLPVTHVIVSHVHPDHSLGLAAYAGEEFDNKPIILGHSALTAALTNNLEFFKEQRYAPRATADSLLELINAGQIQPVNGEIIVDLGGRKIVVSSYDNAHSGSDISVYDLQTKVLWAGDLLFVERLPAIDGSILGWIDALNQLARYDIKLVIPGHGPVGDYVMLVQPQLDYLNWVVSHTREALQQGISLNDFIAGRGIEARGVSSGWKLFDSEHAVNLSKSYIELEWE